VKAGLVIVSAVLLLVAGCKKDVIPPPVTNPPATPAAPQDTTPEWNERFVGSYHGTWTESYSSAGSTTITAQYDTTLEIVPGVPDSTGMTAGVIDSTNTIKVQGSSSWLSTIRFDAAGHYYTYEQGWVIQAKMTHDTLDYAKAYPIGMAGSHQYIFKGKKIQ
jgi:hypothetical protein